MSLYVVVAVEDLDGVRIGYAIHKDGTKKLEDTNIWTEDEVDDLRSTVADMNNRVELQSFWPDAHDPEVVELIEDPEFEPLEYETQELVDQSQLKTLIAAGAIRTQIDEETGEEIVHPEDVEDVPTSVERVLVDPAQPMNRYRKAAEVIARQRLEASHAGSAN